MKEDQRAGLRGDPGSDGHYLARVTAALVDCRAPVGLVWVLFFPLDFTCSTAFFTQSSCGLAQIFKPRLVINLQGQEQMGRVSHILKTLGVGVKI